MENEDILGAGPINKYTAFNPINRDTIKTFNRLFGRRIFQHNVNSTTRKQLNRCNSELFFIVILNSMSSWELTNVKNNSAQTARRLQKENKTHQNSRRKLGDQVQRNGWAMVSKMAEPHNQIGKKPTTYLDEKTENTAYQMGRASGQAQRSGKYFLCLRRTGSPLSRVSAMAPEHNI